MIKTCVFCGKEYESDDKRHRYCSLECRDKAYKQKNCENVKKRRAMDVEYRKKCYEINTRRYFERKHECFVEIAKKAISLGDDVDAITSLLENNCRLRH